MGSNRYLVVSDLHLGDVENHPDGWKAHKASRFVPDDGLRELLEEFVEEAHEDEALTLVLNGDVFDFDLVTAVPSPPRWPLRRVERSCGMDATEEKSVWKLEHILADHGVFLGALAALAAAGHTIVYVMGNHDRELHFPAVREAFVSAICAAGEERGLVVPEAPVRFEPWFFYVPGEVYAEHGQQYDFYCSFRYVLSPVVTPPGAEERLALPMGNLSNRLMLSAMGSFNPHSTDYILGAFGYFMHWLRLYAFTRRSLLFSWLLGSFRSLFGLLRNKRLTRQRHLDYGALLREHAERLGLDVDEVRALEALREAPMTERLFGMVREYWIDRVLISVLMTGGTVALALTPIPLWIKLMVPLACFPLIYLIYENLIGASQLADVEHTAHRYAERIARELPVRVVTFGHSHAPIAQPLSRDVVYVNTGTWAPCLNERALLKPRTLKAGMRNYLLIWFEGGACHTRLGSRMDLDPNPPV